MDTFYKSNFKNTPSQFCVCTLTEIDPDTAIVELGSGNGRDSLYFASQGHITLAMDLSYEEIESCEREAAKRHVNHSYFFQGDLTKQNDVTTLIYQARLKSEKVTFYSRFVIHTLDDEQEIDFLNILENNLAKGEMIYFEFRSSEDAELDKLFGNHFRRYVDLETFHKRLKSRGFEILYSLIGQGMAKYKEEDPFVARIIAQKLKA